MSSQGPRPVPAAGTTGTERKAVEPSGPRANDPSTAGPGPIGVVSSTPENKTGHLNPSAPEDANTTPNSTPKE